MVQKGKQPTLGRILSAIFLALSPLVLIETGHAQSGGGTGGQGCLQSIHKMCCAGKNETANNSCAFNDAIESGRCTAGACADGGGGGSKPGNGSGSGSGQGCFSPKVLVSYANGTSQCESNKSNCDPSTIGCTNSIPGSCSCQAKSGAGGGAGSGGSGGSSGGSGGSNNPNPGSGGGSNGNPNPGSGGGQSGGGTGQGCFKPKTLVRYPNGSAQCEANSSSCDLATLACTDSIPGSCSCQAKSGAAGGAGSGGSSGGSGGSNNPNPGAGGSGGSSGGGSNGNPNPGSGGGQSGGGAGQGCFNPKTLVRYSNGTSQCESNSSNCDPSTIACTNSIPGSCSCRAKSGAGGGAGSGGSGGSSGGTGGSTNPNPGSGGSGGSSGGGSNGNPNPGSGGGQSGGGTGQGCFNPKTLVRYPNGVAQCEANSSNCDPATLACTDSIPGSCSCRAKSGAGGGAGSGGSSGGSGGSNNPNPGAGGSGGSSGGGSNGNPNPGSGGGQSGGGAGQGCFNPKTLVRYPNGSAQCEANSSNCDPATLACTDSIPGSCSCRAKSGAGGGAGSGGSSGGSGGSNNPNPGAGGSGGSSGGGSNGNPNPGSGGGQSGGGAGQGCFNPKTLVRYSNGTSQCESNSSNCDPSTIACTNSIPGSCSCQAKSGAGGGAGSGGSGGSSGGTGSDSIKPGGSTGGGSNGNSGSGAGGVDPGRIQGGSGSTGGSTTGSGSDSTKPGGTTGGGTNVNPGGGTGGVDPGRIQGGTGGSGGSTLGNGSNTTNPSGSTGGSTNANPGGGTGSVDPGRIQGGSGTSGGSTTGSGSDSTKPSGATGGGTNANPGGGTGGVDPGRIQGGSGGGTKSTLPGAGNSALPAGAGDPKAKRLTVPQQQQLPVNSNKALTQNDVAFVYDEVLGRAPEEQEFTAAMKMAKEGMSGKVLADTLRTTDEYKRETLADGVIKELVNTTHECPNPKEVAAIAEAAKGTKPEAVRVAMAGVPLQAGISEKPVPIACPTDEKSVAFIAETANKLATNVLQNFATPEKAESAECAARRASLKDAWTTQQALVAGTRTRMKAAQKAFEEARSGLVNGFIGGVSGVTEAAQKNYHAEMDLLSAQMKKAGELRSQYTKFSCATSGSWKPLVQTEASRKADAEFTKALADATIKLQVAETSLKGVQSTAVAGAAVVTVIMSGGTSMPMLLFYGTSSGTAVGVLSAGVEGAGHYAQGNKDATTAMKDAAWDSLGFTYTAGVTTASLLTGGAVGQLGRTLIAQSGATGVRMVLYNLGAGAAAGGASGVVSNLNKIPDYVSGSMSTKDFIRSAGMDSLFSLLGGGAGAATTGVTAEALSDAALTAIQLWVEGKLTPAEIAQSGPSTAMNIVIGALAGKNARQVKDTTQPPSNKGGEQGAKPGEQNKNPGDLPDEATNFEMLANVRKYLYKTDANGDLVPDDRGTVVSVKLNMGGTQEYFEAYQVDAPYTTFYYLKESDFKEVAAKWLRTKPKDIRDEQLFVQVGSKTIARIPQEGYNPGKAMKLAEATRQAFQDIELIKIDEASGVSQYQAYRNFFERKLMESGEVFNKADVSNKTILHLFDIYAANTEGYNPDRRIRNGDEIDALLKEAQVLLGEAQGTKNPNHPFIRLIKNLNSAKADLGRDQFSSALSKAAEKGAHPSLGNILWFAYELDTPELEATGRGSVDQRVRLGPGLTAARWQQLSKNYYEALFRSVLQRPEDRLNRAKQLNFHELKTDAQKAALEKIFRNADFQQEIRDNSPLKNVPGLEWADPAPPKNQAYLQLIYKGGERTIQLNDGTDQTFTFTMRYHTRTSDTYDKLPNYRIELRIPGENRYRYEYSTLKDGDPLLEGVDHIVDTSGNVFVKYAEKRKDDWYPVKKRERGEKIEIIEDSKIKRPLSDSTHVEYVPKGMVLEK